MEKEKNSTVSEIAAKYFSGNASQDEQEYLRKWINASEENAKYFGQLGNIWATANPDCVSDQIDISTALTKINNRLSGKSTIRRIWTVWGKIAAVLIIPLVIWNMLKPFQKPAEELSFQQPVYNEVYATFGTRTALRLADSSLVWLNSGSSLRYPDKFTGSHREVSLNGEAYFEVKSNEEMPFIVRTKDIVVKATGTKFNILGFNSDQQSEVTLVTGEVSVSDIDINGKDCLISRLVPDQHMIYNKSTGVMSVYNEDTYKYISWKDGKLIFRNEPLSEVAKKISQVFNVDIEIQGNSLNDYRYRATFEDETLSDILKLLEISSPIGYREIKRTPLPDGTFPRKKVIIFPLKVTAN
ncbi:MAG TPA: FecR domain-containing protein [Bacteroidales bacterium]|jgi:ferric-dicitrate binding protein FerR (iron transport regulator)|nr:FecR domain-containing protein [Bacteroidales bacterium]